MYRDSFSYHLDDQIPSGVACGLYYRHIMVVNDESSIVNKFETSLSDDARVIIYNRHMFTVQATGVCHF